MTSHAKISYLKSACRIVGLLLVPFTIAAAITLLVMAELIGIVEEFGA